MAAQDPVRNVQLSAWTKARMQEAHARHGAALESAANGLPATVGEALRMMMQ